MRTKTTREEKARLLAEAEADEQAQPEYIEAVEYVRAQGHRSLSFISTLNRQLDAGKPLTPWQVERVQRSMGADRKDAVRAERAAERAGTRAAKTVDLARIRIDPEVTDGDYAVVVDGRGYHLRVERPKEGLMRGFTVVHHFVGEGVTKTGAQYPQPPAGLLQHQTYRGPLPALVAALVEDPEGARQRYEEMA